MEIMYTGRGLIFVFEMADQFLFAKFVGIG
jgi:hypothetical protein